MGYLKECLEVDAVPTLLFESLAKCKRYMDTNDFTYIPAYIELLFQYLSMKELEVHVLVKNVVSIIFTHSFCFFFSFPFLNISYFQFHTQYIVSIV